MHLIEEGLTSVRAEWISHRMRPLMNSDSPSGHPDELYFMPEILGKLHNDNHQLDYSESTTLIGSKNYLCPLDARDLISAQQYAEAPDPIASLEFLQAAKGIMEDHNIDIMPNNVESAMECF